MTCYLERDTSLLWKDAHRPERANCSNYLVEECSYLWRLSTEMMFEIMSATGVRLVAICEISPAFLTPP